MQHTYPMFTGLTVGIPLSGKPVHPQMIFAVQGLHPPMCFNVTWATTWMQPVAEARNWLAEQALAQNAKYIFFLDEDVAPPGHALRQLIYQAEHHEDGMIFGGIYCHKSPPAAPMVFRGYGAGPYWDWKVGELFEVDGIAMGCTLIKTEVFKHLEKPWFRTVDDMEKYWDGIPKAEVWTEDLYFTAKVKDAGFKIYADGSVICDHWDVNTMQATKLPVDSFPMRRLAIKKGRKKILDIGSGEAPYKTDEGEVVTVDIREEVKPDYRADFGKLPFATGEFAIVHSSHSLEHVARKDVEQVLDEWIRVLKPNGMLSLILPNIEWAAEQIKLGAMNDDVLNVLYGAQSYNENFHKFCFTPKVLTEMLTKRGFKRIDIALEGYNIHCRAWKIPPDEKKVPVLGPPPKQRGRGRPKGTSKKTVAPTPIEAPKRGRGRPKTIQPEVQVQAKEAPVELKRGRGRPKGSTNKVKPIELKPEKATKVKKAKTVKTAKTKAKTVKAVKAKPVKTAPVKAKTAKKATISAKAKVIKKAPKASKASKELALPKIDEVFQPVDTLVDEIQAASQEVPQEIVLQEVENETPKTNGKANGKTPGRQRVAKSKGGQEADTSKSVAKTKSAKAAA